MHISRKVTPSIKLEKETRSVIRMGYPSNKHLCDNFTSHVVLLCSIQRQKRKINLFLHHRALNLNQPLPDATLTLSCSQDVFTRNEKLFSEFSRTFKLCNTITDKQKKSFSLIKSSEFVICESM